MAIDKPTAPSELLPEEFGGIKENFPDSLINTGYEDGIRDILGGANLNFFIDTLGKNFKYHRVISDYISGIPVAKSLIVNSNNKLDYTQYGLRVYNTEEVYGLGEWVVGSIDLGAKKIYESLSLNNTGNALNDTRFWEEVNLGKITSICFRNVGETVFSLTPLNDDTLKLLNGQLIEAANIPDDFSEYITWLRTNAPQCFTTEANWQTINSQYGECGKFVYNQQTGSIRLPKITGIVQGTNTSSILGDIKNAGVPLPSLNLSGGGTVYTETAGSHSHTTNNAGEHNHTRGTMNITGSFGRVEDETASGAFSLSTRYKNAAAGSGDYNSDISFNAANTWTGSTSLSGEHSHTTNTSGSHSHRVNLTISGGVETTEIYGQSSTVQPQTIQGYYYIVFTNNNAQQQVEEIIGDKASKSYVQEQISDLNDDIVTTYATKTDVSKIYKPSGTVTFENLPILSASVVGNVYNVTDGFTTTSDFLEGAGKIVFAGTDVAIVDIGTSDSPIYKYNLLSTNVDMSNYYTKAQVYNKSEIDTKLLEIQTGDVDVSQQISSVVDGKFIEGSGIDFTSGLKTTTTVTSSNEDLTVTSSYSGTRPNVGKETYEFTYDGTNWLINEQIADLSIYYLTVTGTPEAGDKINLEYNTITTTTISTEFDGNYNNLTNKPTIPTVPTALSSFTDDLGSSPTHTHSQYITDISGKEDVLKTINVLATSGTITLTDNSINTITPSDAVTFTLPTITDNTVFHQILVQVNLSTVYTLTLGTSYFFGGTAPDMSNAGVYNLVYEYDKANQYWVCGAIVKASIA